MNYKTVYQETMAEIVEKKSRFIATVFPISSPEEALQHLEKIKKQYWNARHHCWAYILGTQNPQERFSDDGEPSGTAGKPILEVIKGHELCNVLIVVTRYFGGTLLGTGGLVKAYTSASKEGLTHSKVITKIQAFKLVINIGYTELGNVQHVLAQNEATILSTSYTDTVEITALISQDTESLLITDLTEATRGKVCIERMGTFYIDSFPPPNPT